MEIETVLLERLESTTCFGNAYSETSRECGMCALAESCSSSVKEGHKFKALLRLNTETEEAMKQFRALEEERRTNREEGKTSHRQERRNRRAYERQVIGMPVLKGKSVEELFELLESRGGTCEVFESERTQKLRLSIKIKETYIDEYRRNTPEDQWEI